MKAFNARAEQAIPIFAEAKAAPTIVRPAPIVTVTLSGADAILGASQLAVLVQVFGERIPDDAKALLLRISDALAGAK